MILQLKRLFERIGDRQDLDCIIPLEELREYSGCKSIITPISLKGRIQNRAGMVSLDYSCKLTVRHLCDRCLDEFDREYRLEFEHILVKDESSVEDENAFLCPGGSLDLNELAVSDFLAEMPTKVLCREDCKGLCPVCGKNLNLGCCDCGADTIGKE